MSRTPASCFSSTAFTAFKIKLQNQSICPACAFARASLSARELKRKQTNRRTTQGNSLSQRQASTLASTTAINASKDIPPHLQNLHDALEKLRKNAPAFVNFSRVQLALRSLESKRPRIRIAVLGLENLGHARSLSRLLLADVLSERGDWEGKLEGFKEDEIKPILLRYGEDASDTTSDPQVETLQVPSRLLEQHNLEILISTLNYSPASTTTNNAPSDLRRAALVPTAQTPSSFSGAVSLLTYPVHRAIILGNGLQGCLTLGRYLSEKGANNTNEDVALHLASDYPKLARVINEDDVDEVNISITDTAGAEAGISKFRESISNASIYERQWNQSGLPQINRWLSKGLNLENASSINPAVKALIGDIAEEVSMTILQEDATTVDAFSKTTTAEANRQPLNESLKIWAARSHLELRDQLDEAFSSERWRKLGWWKLFWRVDDVTMIMTELIERNWLVEAEKGIIWLAGRSAEAGFHDDAHSLAMQALATTESSKDKEATAEDDGIVARSSMTASAESDSEGKVEPKAVPWPIQIPLARRTLQSATVPQLQSLSQALVLRALSITSLTSALSALVYIAMPGSSLYSCGAIAAFGLAWSLRRLQTAWEGARITWESEAREGGRIVLKDVEESFRDMLRRSALEGSSLETVEAQDSRLAKEAVENLRAALDKVPQSQKAAR